MNLEKIKKHANQVADLIVEIKRNEKRLKILNSDIDYIEVSVRTRDAVSINQTLFSFDEGSLGEKLLLMLIAECEEGIKQANQELEAKVLLMPSSLIKDESDEIPF